MTEIRDRADLARTDAHELALACIEAGISAADPERAVHEQVAVADGRLRFGEETVDRYPFKEVIVLGGGKAAAHVARALEDVLGDVLDGGLVVTDNPTETDRVTILPGSHPVPSQAGVESTRRVLDRADQAGADTLVIGVITGGGSALMTAPAEGICLEDLRETTRSLLECGATIHEINAVRKHLSHSKGGQLAETLHPATTIGLIVSDVVGNDLDVIASGPLVPDTSTFADARAVLRRYDLSVPDPVWDRLERGEAGKLHETPKPGDGAFERVHTHILADNFTALDGARAVVRDRGYDPLVLSSRIEGAAREAAKTQAGIAAEVRATGNPVEPPAVLISGGETTVTVHGGGRGGPNQEFVLSAARSLPKGAVVAAVDTDGSDGASEAAGGILSPSDADVQAIRPALDENDAGGYLAERGLEIVTGPTATNVNDLRVLVIE
ncbi:MAG: glycerate kinase [Halodesulfurarchaeum sp.]